MDFNTPSFKESSTVLRALVHPLRLKIIAFIDKNNSINVNKIYRSLKLEQSITSQHLKILRDANLVETTREGKYIYYSVNYKRIKHVNATVIDFVKQQK